MFSNQQQQQQQQAKGVRGFGLRLRFVVTPHPGRTGRCLISGTALFWSDREDMKVTPTEVECVFHDGRWVIPMAHLNQAFLQLPSYQTLLDRVRQNKTLRPLLVVVKDKTVLSTLHTEYGIGRGSSTPVSRVGVKDVEVVLGRDGFNWRDGVFEGQ